MTYIAAQSDGKRIRLLLVTRKDGKQASESQVGTMRADYRAADSYMALANSKPCWMR